MKRILTIIILLTISATAHAVAPNHAYAEADMYTVIDAITYPCVVDTEDLVCIHAQGQEFMVVDERDLGVGAVVPTSIGWCRIIDDVFRICEVEVLD